VLLSWAVPKGPRSIRKTQRLAMHVRIIRRTRDGLSVIPEGWAGIVMLWDRGT
jgi:hypothetical protein